MSDFYTEQCWIDVAQSWICSREQINKNIEIENQSTINISLDPICGKSAEIRVDGHYVGVSGTGIGAVHILIRFLIRHFRDEGPSKCFDVLNDFFGCKDYSPE